VSFGIVDCGGHQYQYAVVWWLLYSGTRRYQATEITCKHSEYPVHGQARHEPIVCHQGRSNHGSDGTFEEQPVSDTSATASSFRSGNGGGTGIGLFEQLRQNQEKAAREEFQRSIMRGTLALDDDDAAHLQQIQAQKQAARSVQDQQTGEQLASFRAARAERFLHRDGGSGPVELESASQNQTTTFMAILIPISTSLLPAESPFSTSLTASATSAASALSSNMIPVTIKRRPAEPIADTTKAAVRDLQSESNVPSFTHKRAKGITPATSTAAPVIGKDGALSSLLAG
jgi:FAM192A/Fyv6, N-terminal domain